MDHDAEVVCPYLGLTPYTEKEAAYFFGRERETRLIAGKLYAARLTLLYGGSGVGKSSVLRAGVANTLRQEDGVAVVVFSAWQGDPVAGLRAAVAKEADRILTGRGETVETPSSEVASLGDYLRAVAERTGPIMLILDQFEEYFLYHPRDDEPGSFAVEFAKAVNRDDVPASFLISIREDAYTKLDRFKGRIPNLFASYVHLDHLDAAAARRAITKPLDQYNRQFHPQPGYKAEPALVATVVQQVGVGKVLGGTAGVGQVGNEAEATGALGAGPVEARVETPYLQMVMTRLWERETEAGSSVLRLATLEGLGGAERIAQTHLDNALNALSDSEQKLVALDFPYLVTPGGTKIAQSVSDLAKWARVDQAQLEPVLEKLADQSRRILRPVAPPPDQPTTFRYEIFHDVLAPAILRWCREREQDEAARQATLEAERKAREAARQRAAQVSRRLRWGAAILLILTLLVVGFLLSMSMQTIRELKVKEIDNDRLRWELETARTELEDYLLNFHLPSKLVVVLSEEGQETVSLIRLVDDPDLELSLASAFAQRGLECARQSVSDVGEDRTEGADSDLHCRSDKDKPPEKLALDDLTTALDIAEDAGKDSLDLLLKVSKLKSKSADVSEAKLVEAVLHFEQARAYARQGDCNSAVKAATDAMTSQSLKPAEPEPALAQAFSAQAETDFALGKGSHEVLPSLRQAAAFDPHSRAEIAQRCVWFGQQYALLSQGEDALAAFGLARDLDPGLGLVPEAEVDLIQGLVQASAGDYEKALETLGKAKVLYPRLGSLRAAGLAWAYYKVCQQDSAADRPKEVQAACQRQQAPVPQIAPDETITGTVGTGLGDLWAFAGAVGQVVSIEMSQVGDESPNKVTLYGPGGFLMVPDFGSGRGRDSALQIALWQTGVHTVAIRGTAARLSTYGLVLRSEQVAPAAAAEKLVAQSKSYVEGGEYETALKMLEEAVKLDPTLQLVPQAEVDVANGRAQANGGDYQEALATLEEAVKLDPSLKLVPEVEVAKGLTEWGRAQARSGDYEGALRTLHQAQELDLTLQLVPEAEVAVAKARAQAGSGDYEEALATLGRAVELDPKLQLAAEAEVAKGLVNWGWDQASHGDYEMGLATLRQAVELDPQLQLVPEVEVAKALGARAVVQAGAGEYDAALATLQKAIEMSPALEMPGADWNTLCWLGSLSGSLSKHRADVLDACERAVALAPEGGVERNSRGLARALTGDPEGAIQDFEFYVEWYRRREVACDMSGTRRLAWIAALKAGQNPFDAATLEALRNE
jgi:tetratricopeptide (TPR) repeat protein